MPTMITDKQKEQLLQFQELGINTNRFAYEDCVDILIFEYLTLKDELELAEKEKFKRELRRIQRPTN